MNLKLAKKEPNAQTQTISLEEIEKCAEEKGSATFYVDKDNSIKDIQKMRTTLEKNSKSVYWNELRYGLDKDDFLYELHVIHY